MKAALLVLEDGRIFRGRRFGADTDAEGEVVFNTSMMGYQEILTDPSYAGQIVTMTYPMIGNYGIAPEDFEARKIFLGGMIVKEISHRKANALLSLLAITIAVALVVIFFSVSQGTQREQAKILGDTAGFVKVVAAEEYDEKIDFAVINSGALRQDLDPGVLTKGDLISAFPFPNTLVMTKITGAQIEGLFNHAAGMTNGVLQVSKSFKYVIDSNGEIKELRLNGKPIDRKKTYWVASTNFVTLGGDGYWEFTESIEYEDTNIFIVDVVEDYLKDKPLYEPKYEDRIVVHQ